MIALPSPWLLLLPALLVVVREPDAQPVVSADVPAALQRVLDPAGPAIGRPGEAEPLRIFYEERQFRPAWMQDPAGPRVAGLLEVFAGAAVDGLDAPDYDLRPVLADVAGPDRLAAADVALSATLIRYASDLRSGRLLPEKADRDQHTPPKPIDAVQILAAAAAADDPRSYLEGLAPADPTYRDLRRTLAAYRALAAAGGWPVVPEGPTLVPGTADPRVAVLRERLRISGDLPADAASVPTERYDEALRAAVARFQARHGLAADGAVGPRTLRELNVPVESRVRQVLVNLERARWMPDDPGDPHVRVNMAAFDLEVVEAGKPALEMRVVVGRPARSTPVFSDQISYLEFNPYWHVPRTILIEDKLPILRRNPAALTAQGIRVIAPGGGQIDPTTVDWSAVSARNFPYSLRQDPGERNALGRIKFMFPNPWDVYLHDTPSRGLFRQPVRAFSSGCIRVEKPLDLAEFLLRANEGWSRERIEKAIAARRNLAVVLTKPVPVHLVYLTAWMDRMGQVQFRDDLYNRDARLVAALDSIRK